MRKRKFIIMISTVVIAIIFISIVVIYNLFFSMSRLPKGEFLNKSTSADGKYTIKTYLCNEGATVNYAIRGELIINHDSNKTKNIYWDYKVDHAIINWDNNNTVVINGKKIDLPNGKYDWRNDKTD